MNHKIIAGIKFLWWTWHDTDAPIDYRILGVPIGSTVWVITFTGDTTRILLLYRLGFMLIHICLLDAYWAFLKEFGSLGEEGEWKSKRNKAG